MNPTSADVRIRISAQDQGATSSLRGLSGALGGVRTGLGQVITTALGFNVAQLFAQATNEVKTFVTGSVAAYDKQQAAIVQINTAIKSTRGAAHETTAALIAQSTALQKHTIYADDDVNSVQALLLTFTNIHKAAFEKATPAILDLATAMHEDLQSATVQVGKALNDPILGITALHRVGVAFSDKQKELIKHFVETNQVAKAQGIILKELNKEFGGSAAAAAGTYAGRIQQLKNDFNNLQEEIGGKLRAAQADLIKRFFETLPSIQRLGERIERFLMPSLKELWKVITKQLAPALVELWKNVIKPLVPIIGELFVGALKETIDVLTELLKVMTPVIKFMAEHKEVVYALAGAFIALKVSMMLQDAFGALKVGFATFQLITIPSMIASLGALRGAFLTTIPLAIILAELALITKTVIDTINTLNQLNKHQVSAADQGDAITAIRKKYEAGKLTKKQEMGAINALLKGVDFADNQANHRASGGSVQAGQPYIVGESGQELFVPSQSGHIVPNSKMGGNTTINVSVNAQAFMGSPLQARQFAQQILRALQDAAAAKNTTLDKMVVGGVS